MLGRGALSRLSQRGGGGGGGGGPLVSAGGWNLANSAAVVGNTLSVVRPGFDATAATTTYTDTRVITRKVRNVYPNQATDSANLALDDYVYTTDAITGYANNSTESPPPPTAFWMMLDQQLVGNAIHLELAAFHRDARSGRQVAAVKFIATDGTLTVSTIVAATTISTYCEDLQPVPLYIADLDITTLATGTITVNAEVYPWIGDATTVTKSANLTTNQSAVANTLAREFSPRLFVKNVTRFTSPPLAYVASTGVDASGVVSTTAATAAATPFLTVQGAIAGLIAATAVTGNDTSGCRIRITNSVNMGASPAGTQKQSGATLIVERDPATARASAIVTLQATYRPRLGTMGTGFTETSITFTDVTVTRGGSFTFTGEVAAAPTTYQLRLNFWKVILNNGGFTGAWLSNSHDYYFGFVINNYLANLGQINANQHRIMRGLSVDVINNGIEGWVTVGCQITRVRGASYGDPIRGGLHYCNKYLNPDATTAPIAVATVNANETINGFWIVQNLIEVTHVASSTAAVRLSTDAGTFGSTYACGILYNTITGAGAAGRNNCWYDNTVTLGNPIRTQRVNVDKGNADVQINLKGDVFAADSAHVGNFAMVHGVGCAGNLTQFATNSATLYSEYQTYGGVGSLINITTPIVPQFTNASLWTNYQGTTYVGATITAGAGGGTYTTVALSALRTIVPIGMLSHDLGGTARTTTADTSGAYV